MNSKSVGEISEAAILAHLLKIGYSVSIPFGNNQRYDMIVDNGKNLIRAQCKTGYLLNGCISFHTSSTNGFTGKSSGYKGQADIFLVYFPDNGCVYTVPVESVGETGVRLRVHPIKGGATSKIRWAEDYLLKTKTDLDFCGESAEYKYCGVEQ